MDMIELKINGKLYNKSNARKFTHIRGRPMLIKSNEAQLYEQSAILQIKTQLGSHTAFEEPVVLEVHVWYENKRPDLDVSLLQDILEKAGVYKNDRLVHEIHAFKYFDKDNPRVLVRVHLLGEESVS